MDVTHRWLRGYHINWKTGLRDRDDFEDGHRTHCNSFVNAVTDKLGIYMERPGSRYYKTNANAQYDWLITKQAKKSGWHLMEGDDPLKIYYTAQQYANHGMVVVAVYKNKNESKPGHIALIRPAAVTKEQIDVMGPVLIQAGGYNSDSTFLIDGFRKRIKIWPNPEIKLYCNTE